KAIRSCCGNDFLIVTPGVRPAWAATDDQERIMTPKEAIKNGASYLVVGRPITKAEDPVKAANLIVEEMAEALAE
ncbi:MAG: orotidine-5'-phosphate decarboxylase, partial [Firmicutes bacterium]|nr:orotidine-5'-phosphate decarboxylase [Bacillota bacterium]